MADLAQRVSSVRLLLQTLNDPYPTPKGALRPESGPAASRWLPCETCQRRGRIRQRGGWVLCLVCDGRGWRRREPGDRVEWDAYLEMPVTEAVTLPVAPSTSANALAARLQDEADEREGRLDRLAYGWERLLANYERHGSYRELRRQLTWLAFRHPRRYRLVRAVLVDDEPRHLSSDDLADLDLGVLAITLRMRVVKVPRWLAEHDAARTNDTIASLAAEGMTPGRIARKLGIAKEKVRRVLRQRRQRSPDRSV
jgi:hypothetical protein